MSDFTTLEDYKKYTHPHVGSFLDCIKSIENNGVISGDIHFTVINDKVPKGDNYIVMFKITDTQTNISLEFRWIDGIEGVSNDPLAKIVFDTDLGVNGIDFGIYGRLSTSKETQWAQQLVRVEENGNEEIVWTADGYTLRGGGQVDIQWWGGFGLIRTVDAFGYTPTSNSLAVEYYAQRCYVLTKTSEDSVEIGNVRYGIINESYNYMSYLRQIDALDHLIEGTIEYNEKYPYRRYYFVNKTFTIEGERVRSLKGDYIGSGRLCGYITDNEPYNIVLVSRGTLEERLNDETDYHPISVLPRLTSNDTLGGFYGLLDTNIPIFNSLFETVDYLATGDTDGAINEGDIVEDSKTGKDGTIARFERANTYVIRNSANRIMDITDVVSDIHEFMDSLNDPSISDQIKMYWWVSNPIDCLISYYWTPLDLQELCYHAPHTSPYVKFGGVLATNSDGEEITATPCNAQGKEVFLGQYQFNRKYNDWRDYDLFNYRLYLPFFGMVDLEPYFILGKRLEVKYIYYPTNHTIHYMIFVKGNLYKAIDASVGIDLPMTSADAVGKAQQTFSDIANIGGDVVGAVGSLATGNVGGVVGSITDAVSSGLSLAKKPSLIPWGNINPTTNIGDPLQALLYIEEQKTLIPNKLYETYGHANYYIGNIGALSGYCEFSDVRLEGLGSYSDDEKEQIKAILKGGVIL